MSAEINIYGPYSILSGEFPLKPVRKETSYLVEGARFSNAYKKGLWDGRKHLFNKQSGSFPTGLLSTVCAVLQDYEIDYEIIDHRIEPNPLGRTFELKDVKMDGKYSYQLDACQTMVDKKQGIIKIATNGGKTVISCAVTNYLKLNTLFIVTTRELLYQVRREFIQKLDVTEQEVGIVGDGHWDLGGWVTIATLDTLESRIDTQECIDFLASIDVLFIDEAHHVGSETWYSVSTLCPAFYRYGLSGTPLDRTDGANLRLIAATGDVIVDITNKYLVDIGVSARAHIIFDKISTPPIEKKATYTQAYKQGVVENDALSAKVIEWVQVFNELGLSTLVLVEKIKHGNILDNKLWTETNGVFIPHQFIYGKETTEVRSAALEDFRNRTLPVLISSTILDEGIDVPAIDALICAGSRKSTIRTLQRLGRGLRGDKLIVVEFSNFTHDYLLKHSLVRYNDYKNEECFPLYQSGPDLDFVKSLWKK